jgi:hypothetical protein
MSARHGEQVGSEIQEEARHVQGKLAEVLNPHDLRRSAFRAAWSVLAWEAEVPSSLHSPNDPGRIVLRC